MPDSVRSKNAAKNTDEAKADYVEALQFDYPGLFDRELHSEAIDVACGELLSFFEETRTGRQIPPETLDRVAIRAAVQKIYLEYWSAKKAESRSLQSASKKSIKALRKAAKNFIDTLDGTPSSAMKYVRDRMSAVRRLRPSELEVELDTAMQKVRDLIKACKKEEALRHKTGQRENQKLRRACSQAIKLMNDQLRMKFRKTIKLSSDGSGFESEKTQMLYRLIKSIDPGIRPSEVQTAIKAIPPSQKVQNFL